MTLKSAALAPFRAATKAFTRLTAMRFRSTSQWGSWYSGSYAARRYHREVGDGADNSAVTATLGWIARTFPEAPAALWERDAEGEEDMVHDHPMIELLHRPNPFYAGETMWSALLADWHTDGNAYLLKIRNGTGAVKELWWAPHQMIEPHGTEGVFVDYYRYSTGGATVGGGTQVELDPADVIHFRYGLDPDNPRKGRSPLRSVLAEVFTDEEAASYTASILRNMGIPGVIVSPEGDVQPNAEDLDAIKQQVRANFTGERRGEPMVLSAPTKVEQFGFSPAQMNLRDLRRVPEERITAALGVAAIVVGLGAGLDRSTFANFAEAREASYESRIIPDQRVLGAEVRFQLLPDFEQDPQRFRFGFDLSKVRVLQPDENALTERIARQYTGGLIMRSEGRRKLGYEATPDDDVYAIPVSTVLMPALEAGAAALTLEAAQPDPVPPANGNGAVDLPQLLAGAAA